jgi:serine/threonine protein kinase
VVRDVGPDDAPAIPGLRFVRRIGPGDIGVVRSDQQEASGRPVAVEVARADVSLTDEERSRLISVADRMRRLGDHPGIVSILSTGTTSAAGGGRRYRVMDFCPPPDLGERARASRWRSRTRSARDHAVLRGRASPSQRSRAR